MTITSTEILRKLKEKEGYLENTLIKPYLGRQPNASEIPYFQEALVDLLESKALENRSIDRAQAAGMIKSIVQLVDAQSEFNRIKYRISKNDPKVTTLELHGMILTSDKVRKLLDVLNYNTHLRTLQFNCYITNDGIKTLLRGLINNKTIANIGFNLKAVLHIILEPKNPAKTKPKYMPMTFTNHIKYNNPMFKNVMKDLFEQNITLQNVSGNVELDSRMQTILKKNQAMKNAHSQVSSDASDDEAYLFEFNRKKEQKMYKKDRPESKELIRQRYKY